MKNLRSSILVMIVMIPFLVASQINHTVQFSSNNILFTNEAAPDGNTYTKVSLPDFYQVSDTGKPALPVKYIKLIIPSGQTVDDITLSNITSESFSVTYQIYPAQHPIPTCSGCPTPDFVIPDTVIYNSPNKWPAEPVVFDHQGYFDGNNNILTLAICPFEYYPITGQLDFFTSIEINITLTSNYPNGIININRLSNNQPLYDVILSNLVENTQDINLYKTLPNFVTNIISRGPLTSYEYAIITPAAYINAFDDFIDWKKKKGIDIGIVTIEDIKNNYTGDLIFPGDEIYDDAGKVRQYLYDAYQDGMVWALLAGDAYVMPIRYGWAINNTTDWYKIIPTDLYFADFTGNWNVDHDNRWGEPNNDDPHYSPEIFVGRLLCSSSQDVSNWVQKVLIYEKNPGNGNLSYLTESFMFQADQLQQDDEAGNVAGHLPIFNHTIWEEIPSFYSNNPTFPKGADIIAEMNSNYYGLMSWFGHGGTGGQNSGVTTLSAGINSQPYWKLDAEDAYEYYDVEPEINDGLDNLTNYNHPFVIYSISCVITPFDRTKSTGNQGARNCGESFTVNNLAGGIAFLGNTRDGKVTLSSQLYNKFADLLTLSLNQPFYSHIGVSELISKQNYSYHYLRYSHNLIGGPETQMWTALPQYFTVSINPSFVFMNENNHIEVTINNIAVNKQATVCLYKENEVFASQIIFGDANNQAIAIFDNITPISSGEISVTVISHNYIPFETLIPIEDCILSNTPLIIDSDQLWDIDLLINSDIVVESGNVLTISSNISLFPIAKIVIEPGAKLIVDGGTLTSRCNGFWQGIVVQGDPNLSQIPETNQGVLEIKSGGTISNAELAVTVMGTTLFKGGGIVRIDDAVFRNNAMSVWMWQYTNYISSTNTTIPNVSYIKNSLFEINDDHLLGTITPFFIHLWEVDGIQILANTFIDNSTITDIAMRTDGILAYNASFYVNPICLDIYTPCSTYAKNHFEGLNYGIRVMNSKPDIPLTVTRSEFKDVYRGIFLNGVSNATITFNSYEIPDIYNYYSDTYNDPYVDIQPYGLYLNGCNAYTVEENDFYALTGFGTQSATYGAIINNSHDPPNEIYKNDFHDLECGILALNDNRSLPDPGLEYSTGLQIKCNKNQNNSQDIDVRFSDPNSIFRGIAEYQGYNDPLDDKSPAGNTFSHTGIAIDSDYDNRDCNYFIYYHHMDDGTDPAWIPKYYSDNITLAPTLYNYIYEQVCLSNPDASASSEIPISQMYSDLNNAKQNKNSSLIILDIWKDGGNTEQLEFEVELALPPESYQLYNDLLLESPYLSDDVLIAAIQNEDVLTSLMIKLIMIANPHSTRSEDVMDALYNRLNPLPQSWIDEILAGTTYASQLEHLEAAVTYDYHQYKMIIDDLKTRFVNDTINVWAKDSLKNLLSQADEINLRYELAFLYLNEGQYQQMNNVINNIPLEFNLAEEQNTTHQYYIDYLSILEDMRNDSLDVTQLDSIQIDTLQSIANNCKHYPAVWANSLLEQLNMDPEYWYREPIPPDPLTLRNSPQSKPTSLSGTIEYLKVYPNPANDYFTLDYHVQQVFSELRIDVMDVAGRIIHSFPLREQKSQKLIDIREYKPGLYLINLIGDGVIIDTEKLNVNKQ